MKAQVGLEFMAVVIIALFFILTFYVAVFGKEQTAREDERRWKIENLCNNIANKINTAYYFGNGFSQNISLPKNLLGLDYEINILDKIIVCKSGEYVSIEKLIPENITNFTAIKGKIKIENSDSIIVIK